MRISDWSSDVCSSDLVGTAVRKGNRDKSGPPGAWKLEDAKARFSEVVRRAQSEGPQRVTVRGREAVVVISVDELDRLLPKNAGKRSEEHTSELQSLMRISYAVFCLK